MNTQKYMNKHKYFQFPSSEVDLILERNEVWDFSKPLQVISTPLRIRAEFRDGDYRYLTHLIIIAIDNFHFNERVVSNCDLLLFNPDIYILLLL